MQRAHPGHYVSISDVAGEHARAFVPAPLPPCPPLELTTALRFRLGEADRALGELNAAAGLLPDPELFVYMFVRQEAVLSSQIEGTQSSLDDLLRAEAADQPGAPRDSDVMEVSRYVSAAARGQALLGEGWPLTGRMFTELHGILLRDGRGHERLPGQYRTSQNWIGGTRPGNAAYVPPPAFEVSRCMGELERFLNQPKTELEPLLKAGMAHAMFESIHPFLDGNGRLGRMLVTLGLMRDGVLTKPLLYVSLYFKLHRASYYELLQRTRTHGDWETWLEFFLEAVAKTARAGIRTAGALNQLFDRDRRIIQQHGSRTGSTLRVHEALQRTPITSIKGLASRTGLTSPAVTNALRVLESLDVVKELTGRERRREFAYGAYLDTLRRGVQPEALAAE